MPRRPTITERVERLEKTAQEMSAAVARLAESMDAFVRAQETAHRDRSTWLQRVLEGAYRAAYVVGVIIGTVIPALIAGATWFRPYVRRLLESVHLLPVSSTH